MNSIELKLCDIQGRLFELSVAAKLDSASFIAAFMRSELAKHLDSRYNRMQWAGEEYLLEELLDECGGKIKQGEPFGSEMMFWAGYLYRYWHYLTGESSAKIYSQANAQTMKRNYLMFHTLTPELAVEDLREIGRQRAPKGTSGSVRSEQNRQ